MHTGRKLDITSEVEFSVTSPDEGEVTEKIVASLQRTERDVELYIASEVELPLTIPQVQKRR